MKRLLVLMLLCAVPRMAWGFSDSPRAASSDYLLSGATPVNVHPEGDVIRCVNAGCFFVLHRTFPVEATSGAVSIQLRGLSNDNSLSGLVCTKVCLSVVKPGQNPQNVQLTGACSLAAEYAATNVMLTQNLLSVVPVDTTGAPCQPGLCNGAELYIMVNRLPASGPCTSNNNEDYTSLTLGFQ